MGEAAWLNFYFISLYSKEFPNKVQQSCSLCMDFCGAVGLLFLFLPCFFAPIPGKQTALAAWLLFCITRLWVCIGSPHLREHLLLKWFQFPIALVMTDRACSLYSSLSSIVRPSRLVCCVTEQLSPFAVGTTMAVGEQFNSIISVVEPFTAILNLEHQCHDRHCWAARSVVSASISTELSSANLKCDFQSFKKSSIERMNSTVESTLPCRNPV